MMTVTLLDFVEDDGGRSTSGFKGIHDAGDCVVRAIAIAGRLDYRTVYADLAARAARRGKPRSARDGIHAKVYKPWFADNGWSWTPTMHIGSGCTVHVRAGELPETGAHVLALSKHMAALVDGTLRDNHDPSREGTRCVYGFWTAP